MSTLLLNRADVVRHLDALPLLDTLREVFTGARLPAYTIRVQGTFPGADPGPQELLHVHDRQSAALLAVMEAGHLTALANGLVAALATDALARGDASRVALLGAGKQASVALKCLRLVRSLSHVRIWDPKLPEAQALAERTYRQLSLPAHTALTVEEAVADADVIVCATGSAEPLLHPGTVPNGCHVVALGAELSAALIRQSRSFQIEGDAEAGGNGLGALLQGTTEGRQSPEEITVFAHAASPSQDAAAAWTIFENAREDESVQRGEFGAAPSEV